MKTIRLLAFVAPMLLSCSDNEPLAPSNTSDRKTPTVPANNGTFTFTPPENFSCTNILIDASHDGGVWWYPQAEKFNPLFPHQGLHFAELLREKGFTVDVAPRSLAITDAVLRNYGVIIRAVGFEPYTASEVEAYRKAVENGITLLLLSDHQKNDNADEVASMLGIRFMGTLEGKVSSFGDHPMVTRMPALDYMVGSAVSGTCQKQTEPLGWLEDGSVVIASLEHARSRIFVMGDVNTIEFNPQPFADNLDLWLKGGCIGE